MPSDLIAVLGRSEFVRSLRTREYRQARRRGILLEARLERLFELMRSPGAADLRDVDELIRNLSDDFLEQVVENDRETRRSGVVKQPGHLPSLYLDDLAHQSERMAGGDRRSVVEAARELLGRADITLDEDEFNRLTYELQRTLLRAYRILPDEWERDFDGRPRVWSPGQAEGDPATTAAPQQRPPGSRRKVSELVETFLKDSEGASTWTASTAGRVTGAHSSTLPAASVSIPTPTFLSVMDLPFIVSLFPPGRAALLYGESSPAYRVTADARAPGAVRLLTAS